MTIAHRAEGSAGAGVGTVTPGNPAGMANGDGVLIFVSAKPDTVTFVTPAGWTLLADVAGGGGTTGDSVGPTRQAVYFREKDASWSTMPTITVTGGNACYAVSRCYTKSGSAAWSTAAATGTFGSAAVTTNGATTLGSNPGITAGDMCVVGYSNMDDAPTWSARSVSATGISAWGTPANAFGVGTATGNDVGANTWDVTVTTGTATAAPVVGTTLSAAGRGTVALVRLREVTPTVPASVTIAVHSGASVAATVPPVGIGGDMRITRVSHRISSDDGGKWAVAFGFTTEGGVAQPQVTPSPTPSGGKTLSQLLRPLGEVTMWYGATTDIPAGWLRCDGTAIPADYPDLIALIGANTPNMIDVFPIGAGTKAKGTTGGDPTKTIADINLPSHGHPFSRSTALGTTGTIPRGGAADGTTPTSGASGVAATPMDVMPPWRAVHFIIRAR